MFPTAAADRQLNFTRADPLDLSALMAMMAKMPKHHIQASAMRA